MKEEFLHFLWQYKLFNSTNLISVKREVVEVIDSGSYNTNSGPDFLNAKLKIDEQLWVGNVEIHIKSSDWYAHHHEKDVNYDAVILHVVWEHDSDVFMKNNHPIPTVELQSSVQKEVLANYKKLSLKEQRWIPCEKQIAETSSFILNNWLERLYFERLENKSVVIKELLQKSNNNFEAVLFQLLAKNFGLKVNGEAFLQLAQSFDFSVLRKVRFNEEQLSALLFGQAGFLEQELEGTYYLQLQKEYAYIRHKYRLEPIAKHRFQFFRMRPNNFPTVRIAQLIALYNKYQNLFSRLIDINKVENFYDLFTGEVNDFWKTHYTFETASKKTDKRLSKSFIDLLIINTIIPLKFVYEQSRGEVDQEGLLQLIKQLKPENNSIISKFLELKIKANNAFESQALLELKNNYCAKKCCLQCAIGNSLLRK
ncbi:hypothetical protein CSC81_01645 [Tenacibaculum discolor]|uniref:DUF2851 family protein n=1 Tax=Tenacibaculum discolor TaxID=361581 RepID=A0A2G1BY45_9FLAO|nr:DUF2851 family protein [Tenacibaculum discolor]MDP2541206.1 DUF2851 family protein [Tenacibaculum discolor]PHN98914.1 hypothetical protein CSC81_01645 [Tenacibaculum discolor]PHO01624.1 hypothetical protein CSC82_22645 [Rhodobacteraceae bacterium 4F10]